MNFMKKTITTAIFSIALAASSVMAEVNPFTLSGFTGDSFQVAASHGGSCGSAKCGGSESSSSNCGSGKCGDSGKCGGESSSSQCGSGKCGGN